MKRILNIVMLFLFLTGGVVGHAAEEKPFVYDDHGKRDPFWPLVNSRGLIINFEKDLLITDIVLEGIMAGNNGENIAIINGKILEVNDKVGLFVIKKIDPTEIILEKGQKSFTLKLKKGGLR